MGEVAGLLRRAGLRPTTQRRIIVTDLIDRTGTPTALELHALLRDAGHRVGLSTVYRTLGALAEAGVVHTFPRRNEVAFRRCADGPHQHLICLSCGRIEDLAPPQLDAAAGSLAYPAGFTVQGRRTDVYGVCAAC
ncbi:Fur family transcriptional regulator [Cellulomonas fimi]|uniref:Transcriptional repressor n=1 Tax=Cellulomonas fimi TaxID=1708 RepID=A0A7Y0LZF8_CELFI|nr:Fur family transcriptional regulator [Cellulomonas fimi]NMR20248.1 transcriptional repressor [Cellulomonas fimi]